MRACKLIHLCLCESNLTLHLQVGEQPLDGLFHVLWRGGPESHCVVRGRGHPGYCHPRGGVEVPVFAQDGRRAALQHL